MPKTSSSLLKRRLEIAEIVRKQGEIKVDDLSEQLGVSGVTIRGDLNYLEQQGYLKRSFGGAIYTAPQVLPQTQSESPTFTKHNIAIELELVRQCSRLIQDRDTLFLGYGSLTRKIIPLLSSFKKLRIIVNDLDHAILASDYIDGDIIVAGSDLIRGQHVLTGKQLESVFQQYTISHCIFEIQSIAADNTFGIALPLLIPYYQQLIDKALNTTAVVTDSAMNNKAMPQSLGQLNDLSHLVSCRSVATHYQQQFIEAGFNNNYANNECFTWFNNNKLSPK